LNRNILIVEDKTDIGELLVYHLEKAKFHVFWALNGKEALQLVRENSIDLIVLDLMLPKVSGFEILRLLKSDLLYQDIPVIIESAKSEDDDIIHGLELGADDYVTKPFSPKVLLARIHRILDRHQKANNESISLFEGELIIDVNQHVVSVKGKVIHLTAIEFDLLSFMIRNKNNVMSREQILGGVWKEEVIVIDRVIDVHINSLRNKLGTFARYLQTIRGVGYIFLNEDLKN